MCQAMDQRTAMDWGRERTHDVDEGSSDDRDKDVSVQAEKDRAEARVVDQAELEGVERCPGEETVIHTKTQAEGSDQNDGTEEKCTYFSLRLTSWGPRAAKSPRSVGSMMSDVPSGMVAQRLRVADWRLSRPWRRGEMGWTGRDLVCSTAAPRAEEKRAAVGMRRLRRILSEGMSE